MQFVLGCNYWGSKNAVDMLAEWDVQGVERDLSELSKCGSDICVYFPIGGIFSFSIPLQMERIFKLTY